MLETIQVRAKDIIVGVNTGFQHAYIVYTNSQGQEYYIRGGAENREMFFGNLEVEGASSLAKYEPGTVDYDNGTHWDLKTYSGTDLSLQFAAMRSKGMQINNANYDYEIGYYRNSNFVVDELLKYASFDSLTSILNEPSNSFIIAPFSNTGSAHSATDVFFDWIVGDAAVESYYPISFKYHSEDG